MKNCDEFTGEKVLIVDDSISNQMLFNAFLKKENLYLEKANNGKEAIEKIELQKYDLIIMDLQMPIMNGMECTKLIRKNESLKGLVRTPIIVMSATPLTRLGRIVEESDMDLWDQYLSKPVDRESFLDNIKYLLGLVNSQVA